MILIKCLFKKEDISARTKYRGTLNHQFKLRYEQIAIKHKIGEESMQIQQVCLEHLLENSDGRRFTNEFGAGCPATAND